MAPRERKPVDSDDGLKKKKTFFKRMFPGFKKKATELSILCGNSVGFICHGPDNDLHVWPEPEENPQALPQIVAKFNGLSDQKRKNHACDLSDFLTTQSEKKKDTAAFESSPVDLEGLSVEELTRHLSNLESHLVGIGQKKTSLLLRNSKSEPKPVSDNATVSNHKVGSLENRSSTQLGFDELSCVIRGSNKTGALNVSRDVGVSGTEADSSRLGFSEGDYFPAEPTAVTYNQGFCSNDGVCDLEFPPTVTYAEDTWAISDYNRFLGNDSFMPNTYQTSMMDNWGLVGFE